MISWEKEPCVYGQGGVDLGKIEGDVVKVS